MKLDLTPQSLNIIIHALADIPYKFAKPVMDEIGAQIDAQKSTMGATDESSSVSGDDPA